MGTRTVSSRTAISSSFEWRRDVGGESGTCERAGGGESVLRLTPESVILLFLRDTQSDDMMLAMLWYDGGSSADGALAWR